MNESIYEYLDRSPGHSTSTADEERRERLREKQRDERAAARRERRGVLADLDAQARRGEWR